MVSRICPLCGLKCSIFTAIISVWGIIFLSLMGVFFHIKSGILFPDVAAEMGSTIDNTTRGNETKLDLSAVEQRYESLAQTCWVATALYGGCLIFALWQYRWNMQGPPTTTPANYRAFQ